MIIWRTEVDAGHNAAPKNIDEHASYTQVRLALPLLPLENQARLRTSHVLVPLECRERRGVVKTQLHHIQQAVVVHSSCGPDATGVIKPQTRTHTHTHKSTHQEIASRACQEAGTFEKEVFQPLPSTLGARSFSLRTKNNVVGSFLVVCAAEKQ